MAELVGVSRQAVTKWEAGQSAPSTDNLFRLAEIFHTTVDLLLTGETVPDPPAAEAACPPDRSDIPQKFAAWRAGGKENLRVAPIVAAAYLVIFLMGKLICCDIRESGVLGLLSARIPGNQAYLFGWLLSSGLYWAAMVLSVLAALLGRWRFALMMLAAFGLGLLAGELLGPNPAGKAYGHGHYGWAIWGGFMLAAAAAGTAAERLARK